MALIRLKFNIFCSIIFPIREKEPSAIAWNIVTSNIIPTSITNTLQTEQVTDWPCWETLHWETKDFWNNNIASFTEWQSVCDNAKKTFTCNNWKWIDWLDFADTTTYKYSNCILWEAANCNATYIQ